MLRIKVIRSVILSAAMGLSALSFAFGETVVQKSSQTNPLRSMASDYKTTIQLYRQKRELATKLGVESKYDILFRRAKEMAEELEAASDLHDVYMEMYQKGDLKSGRKAVRLAKFMKRKGAPFNALLWHMERMISEIKSSNEEMPHRVHTSPMSHSRLQAPRLRHISRKKKAYEISSQDDSSIAVARQGISNETSCAEPKEDMLPDTDQKQISPMPSSSHGLSSGGSYDAPSVSSDDYSAAP